MSFDAWVVAFGLSSLLRTLQLTTSAVAFALFGSVVALDLWLLYRFFRSPRQPDDPAAGEALLHLTQYIDVLIPQGHAELIRRDGRLPAVVVREKKHQVLSQQHARRLAPRPAVGCHRTLMPYISPSGSAISSSRAPLGSRK